MVQHTSRGLPYPEGTDSVRPRLRDIVNLAINANTAITESVAEGAPLAAAPSFATGTNLNDITEGSYGTVIASDATNTPPGAGNGFLLTLVSPGGNRLQVYYEFGHTASMWRRFRSASAWGRWTQMIDGSLAESPAVDTGTNLDDIDVGTYRTVVASGATNTPPGAGNGFLLTLVSPGGNRLQVYYEFGHSTNIWRRFRSASAWGGWRRIDAAEQDEGGGGGEPPSALKTLPVILSASTNFAPVNVATGGVRFPLNINAPITRWRLCIRNHNYRLGSSQTGGASFTGLWVGPRSGKTAAFTSAPTRVSGPFTLPEGGQDFALPWVNDVAIGDGVEQLLSLGWNSAGQAVRSPAGCYRSTTSGTGGVTSGAGYTSNTWVPFSWWLEVETSAGTPAVATWGSSSSVGVGNDEPIHESFLSQYCRQIGAVPVHVGYPGTNMGAWEPGSSNYEAWGRFAHLSRPDAVLHFMGPNDLLTSDQTEMRRRYLATVDLLKRYVSPNVFLVTLPPSSTRTTEQNNVRKAYNTWLHTLPGGARDIFEFSDAVRNAADDALAAWADSGDALHPSTAGSTALAGAITRPVTTERTDRDTGWRQLPAHPNIQAGTVKIRRAGPTVSLVFDGVTLTGFTGGGELTGIIPAGFRPAAGIWPYGTTARFFSTDAARPYRIESPGNVEFRDLAEGDLVRVTATYLSSDPWPSTLPGSPA